MSCHPYNRFHRSSEKGETKKRLYADRTGGGGREERGGRFCKGEVILISGESRDVAFFLQRTEPASLLGAEEASWAE